MRQGRHIEIKQSSIFDSELGEVERETRGVPLTGGPCLREKILCEFSDLLLCCLLPGPLREQTVMARALIQRKTPCGWSKGDSIGWKRSPWFFKISPVSLKMVSYAPFGSEFPALVPLSDAQRPPWLALHTLLSEGSTALREGIQLSNKFSLHLLIPYLFGLWLLLNTRQLICALG